MNLDLATVLALHPISLFLGTTCFLYLRLRAPQHRGLGKLAAAFLLLASGSILAGMGEQDQVSYGFWTLTSFACGPFAYTLLWIGLRDLVYGRPTARWPLLLAFPVALVVLAALTGFHLVNLYRASVFLSVMAASAFASAWLVLGVPLQEKLETRYPLAAVLGVKSAIGLVTIASIAFPNIVGLTPAQMFALLILCQFTIAMFVLIFVQERVERRLISLSETDALTRINNRRWLYGRMPERVASRDAFLVIDIDHFKAVNDRHGHAAGDDVLTAVAQALKSVLPRGALLARTGGEEFGLFLPHDLDCSAATVAESLRRTVDSLSIVHQGERIPVTVSIGLAVAHLDKPLSALMADADGALYFAKQAGRNRVARCGDLAVSEARLLENVPDEMDKQRCTA